MGDKQSLSQVSKVTFFKPRVCKMIWSQITSEFTVITSFVLEGFDSSRLVWKLVGLMVSFS